KDQSKGVRLKRTAQGEFLTVGGKSYKKTRAMQYRTYFHCLTRNCPAFFVLVELSRRPRLTKHHDHAKHCGQCQ
ncbi:hypothetical protein KR084_004457, partial [Drosophila pseudotakahashii]